MEVVVHALPVMETTGRQVMQTPEDVALMLRLKAAGVGNQENRRKTGLLEEHGAPVCAQRRLRRVQAAGALQRR